MMTPEQEIARKKRLVSASRSLVAGQQGLTIASNRILSCLYDLGDEWVDKHSVFKEYRNALPMEVPVGTERLHWSFDKLLELDPILADLEYRFRAKLMAECCNIITKYC
jgi:hypothetical protein